MDTAALRTSITDTTVQASAHWSVLAAWLTEPGLGAEREDRRSLEVGFQTGTDADRYPVDIPPALDAEQAWFWLGFVRRAGDEQAAVVLWFAPTDGLRALRQLPTWDVGNALGLDFLARRGHEMRSILDGGLAQHLLGVFGGLVPAAIEHVPA